MPGRATTLALAVLLLAACSAQPLLRVDPAQLGSARTAQQRLRFERDGQGRAMDMVLDLDARRLRIVGSALGVRVFALDYDGRAAEVQHGSRLPRPLRASRVVNDLLLVFAPEPALRAALGRGWTLRADAEGRTLSRGGRPLIEVRFLEPDPWNGRSELVNSEAAYRLVIDSAVAR